MSLATIHDDVEPFGQRGVRPLIRPVVIGCCAILMAVAVAMGFRSAHNYDRLYRTADGRPIEIASAMGRLMVTTWTVNRAAPSDETWTYESWEFGTMYDPWQPSIWKTIGIDWGTESAIGRGWRPVTYWRFRLLWRTVLIAAAVPLVADALLRRRRGRQREPAFEVVPRT